MCATMLFVSYNKCTKTIDLMSNSKSKVILIGNKQLNVVFCSVFRFSQVQYSKPRQ